MKGGPRRRFIAADRESPHTLAYYESPHRLVQFLTDLIEVLGDRRAAVASDLTKQFEKIYRGTLSEVLASLQRDSIRGEYCVVVEGAGKDVAEADDHSENRTVY